VQEVVVPCERMEEQSVNGGTRRGRTRARSQWVWVRGGDGSGGGWDGRWGRHALHARGEEGRAAC